MHYILYLSHHYDRFFINKDTYFNILCWSKELFYGYINDLGQKYSYIVFPVSDYSVSCRLNSLTWLNKTVLCEL